MKLVFVVIGAVCLVFAGLSAWLARKRSSSFGMYLSGILSMFGLLIASATPMKNGELYRIEKGSPVHVPR